MVKRAIAWWIPLVAILVTVGTASVAPIPVTQVQVGNETITITTADIVYRYIIGPVRHGAEKALSRIPVFVQENVTANITVALDQFEINIQQLLYLDEVQQNWATVIDTVKNMNFQLTGEYSTNIILCAWKGVFEVCRTYELNEAAPGFTKVADTAIGNYVTIRLPYGIVLEVNQAIEEGNIEEAIKILTKAVIRKDIEFPEHALERIRERIEEMHRIREHAPHFEEH